MKLLIDECLPRALKRLLIGHECRTVREMGWSGTTNGELLTLAEPEFDVFVTIDQSLQYQQSLTNRRISLLVFTAKTNQIEDLAPAVPNALSKLRSMQPGTVTCVE